MRTQLGPFQILEVVGRGGMGTVYRGLDPIIGRPVAVKVIRLVGYNDRDEQSWLRARLFSEARSAGNLFHPNIVTIYQVGEADDVAYIAMEFVDGPSLRAILDDDRNKKDDLTLCQILVEAASALDYAHERGLVHRDIKPANIMVNATGIAKVTDFGIAKTALSQTITKTGLMVGTPSYMSPEQIRGTTLDGRSDQFSLAVVAYEIFTGRKPFVAEQATSICYQIIHEEPASADDVNPAIGHELANVLKRGLAKDPESRYRTCMEFASALASAVQGREARVCCEAASPGKEARLSIDGQLASDARPVKNRNRFLPTTLLAALMIVLSVFAFTWKIFRDKSLSQTPITTGAADRNVGRRPVQVKSDWEAAPTAAPIKPRLEEKGSLLEPKPTLSVVRLPAPSEPPNRAVKMALAEPEFRRRVLMVWTGDAAPGDLVTIRKAHASAGHLAGLCPELPSSVTIHPADWSQSRLTVFTAEAKYAKSRLRSTPRGAATFVFDPRHATDLSAFELPNYQNGWGRLVVRINAQLTAFLVECELEI